MIDVIIPTKSNFSDLKVLLGQLEHDESVNKVVVVCDGPAALAEVGSYQVSKLVVVAVPLSSGIHFMWNIGMDVLEKNNSHIAFINDDISLSVNAMSKIADLLEKRTDIGLATPCVDESIGEEFLQATGFAGFCMVLAKDLVPLWRFDEEMKWWYGDTDIICWVSVSQKRATGITGLCSCSGNRSQTINNDPPANFHKDIENDARIFHKKWPTTQSAVSSTD
jgi:hypothetical protein